MHSHECEEQLLLKEIGIGEGSSVVKSIISHFCIREAQITDINRYVTSEPFRGKGILFFILLINKPSWVFLYGQC